MLEDFRLKVFVTVVREGSFTKAAGILDISQPAVSQNISELERLCGACLLSRMRGDMSLTDEGRVLFAYAVRLLSLCSELGDVMGTAPKINDKGSLRVSAKNLAGLARASEALVPFLSSVFPSLEITLGLDIPDADVYITSGGTVLASDSFASHPLFPLVEKRMVPPHGVEP